MSNSTASAVSLKQTAISTLVNEDSIIRLVDERYVGRGDELIGENIFPFLKIPAIQDQARTYICCSANILRINLNNDFFKDIELLFHVISHKDINTLPGGSRIDLIGDEIVHLFEGAPGYGYGSLKLTNSVEESLTEIFLMRTLHFTCRGTTRDICGD